MKRIILSTSIILSFNALSEVSNYEYNHLIDDYNSLSNEYNSLLNDSQSLSNDYESLLDKYNSLSNRHNKLVDSYNELIFNKIMSKIKKIQLDEEISDVIVVGERPLHGYGNRCLLGSTIYTDNGKEYSISFDFEKGIGWSKPSIYRDSIKIDGSTPGVTAIARPEDEIKELQRLFIEESNVREELANMFRQLHKKCYTN